MIDMMTDLSSRFNNPEQMEDYALDFLVERLFEKKGLEDVKKGNFYEWGYDGNSIYIAPFQESRMILTGVEARRDDVHKECFVYSLSYDFNALKSGKIIFTLLENDESVAIIAARSVFVEGWKQTLLSFKEGPPVKEEALVSKLPFLGLFSQPAH